jgi:hypothetical protein
MFCVQNFLYLVIAALSLSSCDSVKHSLGLAHNGPEEIFVSSNNSLTFPPEYVFADPDSSFQKKNLQIANLKKNRTSDKIESIFVDKLRE